MPELPDVQVYVEALSERLMGETLQATRIPNPFVVRSVHPPVSVLHHQAVTDVRRLGKRIVLVFPGEKFLVFHLMIAGRLRWRDRNASIPKRMGLAAFDFSPGTVLLTEAGMKRRASLHVLGSAAELAEMDRGGIEPLQCTLAAFRRRLASENHTLKRALTDPRLFSGIGNAYSDEILHAARLSPLTLTSRISRDDAKRLFHATRSTLQEWVERLRSEANGRFPEKVTAFRNGMAVHGRYKQPCPVCSAPVQRIRYAENEVNYCAPCQTGGNVLADRALSRLLREDWPRSIDAWEEKLGSHP